MSFLAKRKNGIYEYNLSRGGERSRTTRLRISTGERDIERALVKKAELDLIHNHKQLTIGGLITYYDREAPAELSAATKRKNLDALRHLQRITMDKRLTSITRPDIEAYKRDRIQSVKPVSVNSELRALQSVFSYLISCEILKRNPMQHVKPFPSSGEEAAYITREQCQQLINAAQEPWLKDIITIAFETGMRPGEIANLTTGQIDLAARTITIRASSGFRQKLGKVRTVPLSPIAYTTLTRIVTAAEHVEAAQGTARLFSYSRSFISHKVKRAIRKAGLPERINFRSLRHSFATDVLKRGVPIDVVRRILGHASIHQTDSTYSHIQTAQLGHYLQN